LNRGRLGDLRAWAVVRAWAALKAGEGVDPAKYFPFLGEEEGVADGTDTLFALIGEEPTTPEGNE
jgi:hypothetical protein